VRGLVEYLVGTLEQLGGVAAGGAADAPAVPGPARAAGYRATAVRAVDGWAVTGRLDTEYPMPWGASTGRMLAEFLVVEQVAHGGTSRRPPAS